jgi:hypothetical protein
LLADIFKVEFDVIELGVAIRRELRQKAFANGGTKIQIRFYAKGQHGCGAEEDKHNHQF